MKALSRFRGAVSALLRRFDSRGNGGLISSRLDGLGQSKIRSGMKIKPWPSASLIDLASGAPAFATPTLLKQEAVGAILADHNQYTHPAGDLELRKLIAKAASVDAGSIPDLRIEPDRHVTVTSGTSAALAGVLLAVVDKGSEVIVLEPFFESYASAIRFAGGVPKYVPLTPLFWTLDHDRLAAAFNKRTRAVIINSPHNPTGRCLSAEDLEFIAGLCERHNCVLISDEIYGQISFTGKRAPSVLACRQNRERNVVIDGLSKAYNATGWRVGYVIGPPKLTEAFRIVHSVMGLSAPTPLQVAAKSAWSDLVLRDLQATVETCRSSRDILATGLRQAGFRFHLPEGATYLFADVTSLGAADEQEAMGIIVLKTGITSVGGDCFFDDKSKRQGQWLRFCFARDRELLVEAARRLQTLKQ